MNKVIILLSVFLTFSAIAAPSEFDRLLPILTKEEKEEEISPKTTLELQELFKDADQELPRVFVKKLPPDFTQKGNKKLYAQVLAALLLRENEQILNERILFLLLKEKADKGEKWTQKEQDYFDYLVDKYDAIVLKTTPTKINDLIMKIDEIPLSLAIAQSALDTDFGKKNENSPFGQQGWLNNQTYAPIQYKNLPEAVKAYVKEMNSTPNYDDFHRIRAKHTQNQTNKASLYMAMGLRTYRPEDTAYVENVKRLLTTHPFLFKMDDLNLKKDK